MNKLAIRLLTLSIYVAASVAVPMVMLSKAAAETSKATKKPKKTSSAGAPTPTTSSQYPPNMSEDPNRRVGY